MSKNSKKKSVSKKARPVSGSGTSRKRRKMNWKERLGLFVAVIAAIALSFVMVIHMPVIPYEGKDPNGNTYITHISMMQKFKNWKPFEEMNGKLDEKDENDYSLVVKDEVDEVIEEGETEFDDGLDLDQIREGQFGVLFLGLDELRSNTDVMMLIMFDIAANKINILQIPRDTFVPDHTSFEAGKINSVYTMGNKDVSQIQRTVDCVEEVFQVPIDRYIITSCTDIVRIVDLVGGIPIDMPYTIEYEPGKTIYAGEQVLNGQQSEWMVRYRHGYNEGDIGRMKAQRIFLAAAMAKACDIGSIKLINYIDTIVEEKLIGSNLSMHEISMLSDFATVVGMENIHMFMLPGEGYNYYPEDWVHYDHYSVWSVHKEPTIDLLNKYFRPYYQPVFKLPIRELVTVGNYQNTMYDNDDITFEEIENGDTFNGK
ncbi:MAG: LCP family protein [Oscillospiraceae bacterium]|nr:LCP family protein [Oscillospiraceae bacterium]